MSVLQTAADNLPDTQAVQKSEDALDQLITRVRGNVLEYHNKPPPNWLLLAEGFKPGAGYTVVRISSLSSSS